VFDRTVRAAATGNDSEVAAFTGSHPYDDRAPDARDGKGAERKGAHVRDSVRADDEHDYERDRTGPGRDQQPVAQHLAARGPPRQDRSHCHQEEQRDTDRHAEPGEVRLPHRDLFVLQRLDEEREDRPGEDDERETGEQEIVQQERGFPGDGRVDLARRAQLVATPRDECDAAERAHPEEGEEPRADARLRERMHRVDDTGPRQERAEDG